MPRTTRQTPVTDFELPDGQAAFRDLMRDFARREIKPLVREWERSGRNPTEIVEQMRGLGLFGLLVPRRRGVEDPFVLKL